MWLVMSRCCVMFAVEEFRRQHPQEFATLTKVLVNCNRIHYKKEKLAHFCFSKTGLLPRLQWGNNQCSLELAC